jgi:hypothetical protein
MSATGAAALNGAVLLFGVAEEFGFGFTGGI